MMTVFEELKFLEVFLVHHCGKSFLVHECGWRCDRYFILIEI